MRQAQASASQPFGVELIEPRILLSATPLITGLTPDTGLSNTDGITAATVLKLVGTSDPNANVQIADGSSTIGTARAGTTGTWSFTTQSLAQGTHTFTATSAGSTSATKTAVVDTTPPAAPILAAQPSFTRSATPIISGVAEAGSTVYVHDGTSAGMITPALGTAKADQNGNWSFQVTSPLSEGTHAFRATAVDVAGNQSANSGGLYITIDRTAPVVGSATESLSGPTRTTSQTVRVTASDTMSGVQGIEVFDSLNGAAAVDLGPATLTNGAWVFTKTGLVDGSHSFTVVATDKVGNSAAPVSAGPAMVVDTVAPTAPILAAQPSITRSATPTISGTAEAGATIYVHDGTAAGIITPALGTAKADQNGSWTFQVASPLAEGTHAFRATSVDAAGNTSPNSAGLYVTIDSSAPAVASATGSVSGLTRLTSQTIRVAASDAQSGVAGVEVFDSLNGAAAVDLGAATLTNGSWVFTKTGLSDGTHAFTIVATDKVGNSTAPISAGAATVVDTTAPIVTSTGQSASGLTKVAAQTVTAVVSDATSTVAGVEVYGSLNGGQAVDIGAATLTNGTWVFSTAGLADGAHSFTVVATDVLGNSAAPVSAGAALVVDTAAPGAPVLALLPPLTKSSTPALSGTAEAGSTVSIFDGGATGSVGPALGTATTDQNGNWAFQVTGALADGTHAFRASATDPAGNTGPMSTPVSVKIDTLAPEAPVLNAVGSISGDNRPPLSGTAEAGSLVTVFDGATALGTTVATGSGTWSFTPPTAIPDGPHAFSATATDPAGNVSAPPAGLTIRVSADLWNGDLQPYPQFTVTIDGQQVGSVFTARAVHDNDAWETLLISPGPLAALPRSIAVTFVNDAWGGDHATDRNLYVDYVAVNGVRFEAENATNNAAPPGYFSPGSAAMLWNDALTFTPAPLLVDTAAPAAPIVSALPAATANLSPVVTGSTESGATVTVYDGSTLLGRTTAGPSGAWSFTYGAALTEGPHAISATATDLARNTGPASAPTIVVVDTTAPAAPLVDALPALINGVIFPISGLAEPGSTVTVFDGTGLLGTTTASSTGTWALTPAASLSDGSHSISARATDAAGNTGLASNAQAITVDSLLVTWTNAAGGSWSDAANWSTGALPGANAHVRLDLAQGAQVVFDLPGSATIGQLAVVSGTLTLGSGNLNIGGALTNAANLVLQRGALLVGGSVVNSANLSVQADATMTVNGTLTLSATSRVTFEIADFDYFGAIKANSDVSLAGVASVTRRNGYMPSLGTNYGVIVTTVLPSGSFSDVQNTLVGNGTKLQLSAGTAGIGAAVTTATTKSYYIDPNAAAGGDGSIDRPYSSFGQLPSRSGNLDATIFLKRGTLIRETLQFDNATNFIVDAYGDGAAPIISGADRVSAAWIQEGSNWFLANISQTQAVFEDGTRYQAVTSKDLLVAGTSWWDASTSRLYVSTLSAQSPNGQNFEMTVRGSGLDARDSYGFTVRNIQIQRTADVGLHVQAGQNAQGVTPRDVLIEQVSSIYNGCWDFVSRIGDGFCVNGLSASAPAQNIVFRSNTSAYNLNCAYEANGVSGLVLEGNTGDHCGNGIESYLSVQNATITRNVIQNIDIKWLGHGNGLWLTDSTVAPGAGGHKNIVVSNNIFQNTRMEGLNIGDGVNLTIDGNVLYNCVTAPADGSIASVLILKNGTGEVSYRFTNNIVQLTRSMFAIQTGAGTSGTLDYNNYYGAGGAHAVYSYLGSYYTSWASGFTDYRGATGQDAHSYSVDPGFVGSGADPFQLRSTSALAAAGSATGAARYDLARHLYGATRPIGPYSTVQLA